MKSDQLFTQLAWGEAKDHLSEEELEPFLGRGHPRHLRCEP